MACLPEHTKRHGPESLGPPSRWIKSASHRTPNDDREEGGRRSTKYSIPRTIKYGRTEKIYHPDVIGEVSHEKDDGQDAQRRSSSKSCLDPGIETSTYGERARHQASNVDASIAHDSYGTHAGLQNFSYGSSDRNGKKREQSNQNVPPTSSGNPERQRLLLDQKDVSLSNPLQNSSRQSRGGAPAKPMSSAPRPTQGCLSHLAGLFTEIDLLAFSDCEKFVKAQPAILDEPELQFLCQAAIFYRANELQSARACVHRALLIRKCSGMNSAERVEYLQDLGSKRASTTRALIGDLDNSYDGMKEKSKQLAAAADATIAKSIERPAPGSATHAEQEIAVRHRQASTYPVPQGIQFGVFDTFSTMRITTHADIQNPTLSSSTPANPNRHGATTDTGTSQGGSDYQSSLASVRRADMDYRGTEGEVERLDSRYKRQRKSGEYFLVGKVFAILWDENVGNPDRRPGSDVVYTEIIGRYGERIFSHIRRMVVVRKRYGYCWCVAINTYGGKGVGGKRRSMHEAAAHTIAFDSRYACPPRLLEEDAIVKEAIAIDLNRDHTLDAASRLNFAKVFTVEHNVKVMAVGRIAQASMPYFLSYWRNEMTE